MAEKKRQRLTRVIATIASLALVIGLVPAPALALANGSSQDASTALTAGSGNLEAVEDGQLAAQDVSSSGVSVNFSEIAIAKNIIEGIAFSMGSGPVSWGAKALLDDLFGDKVDTQTQQKLNEILNKLDEIRDSISRLSDKVTTVQLQAALDDLKFVLNAKTPWLIFDRLHDIDADHKAGKMTDDAAKTARLSALTESLGITDFATINSDWDQYVDKLWTAMTYQYNVTIGNQPQKLTLMQVHYELLRRSYKWEHQAYQEWAFFEGRCVSLLATVLVLEKASLQARIDQLTDAAKKATVQKRLDMINERIAQTVGGAVKKPDGTSVTYPGLFSEKTWANEYWMFKERDKSERYYWVPGHEIVFYAQVNGQKMPQEDKKAGLGSEMYWSRLRGVKWVKSGSGGSLPAVKFSFWQPFVRYQGGNTLLASADQLQMIYKDYGSKTHLYDIFISEKEGNFQGLNTQGISKWWFVVDPDSKHELEYVQNFFSADEIRCSLLKSADASADQTVMCYYHDHYCEPNTETHYIGIGVKSVGQDKGPSNGGGTKQDAKICTRVSYGDALPWSSGNDLTIGYDSNSHGKVVKVSMDGKTVSASKYKASTSKSNGGTVVLSKTYVANLGNSKHTLELTTEKGSHTVTFSLKKAGRSVTVKKSTVKTTFGAKGFNLGAAKKGSGKLIYKSSNPKVAKVDARGKVTIKGSGIAEVSAVLAETKTLAAAYATTTVTVKKAANPFVLANAARTVEASKVKEADQTVAGAKVAKKAKGKIAYSITKAVKDKKSFRTKFSISKSTGKITVKKGTAKGTYTVKVKAVAKGNANYKSKTKNAIVTVIVA